MQYMKFILFLIPLILLGIYKLITSTHLNLNNTHLSIALFSMITVLINQTYSYIMGGLSFLFSNVFVSTLNIDSANKESIDIVEWIEYYMSNKLNNNEMYSTNRRIEGASSNKKIWYDEEKSDGLIQTKLIVGDSYSLMWEKDYMLPILIERHSDTTVTDWRGSIASIKYINMYDFFPMFGKKRSWDQVIEKTRNKYKNDFEFCQKVYESMSYYWNLKILKNKYNLKSGIYAVTPQMNKIIEHIKYFLSPECKKHYKEKGFNNAYRMCIHGPPGTGKSNIITRIAGEFNLPLYYLSLPLDDDDLKQMINQVQRGIIVVEEIDNFIAEINDVSQKVNKDIIKNDNNEKTNKCPSLSTWHYILDSLTGSQVIIYMTTNNYDLLKNLNQGSFLRPERIDFTICLDEYISTDFINEIINKYFDTQENYINITNKLIKITPAEIVNIIKESHEDKNLIINTLINRVETSIDDTNDNYPHNEIFNFVQDLIKLNNLKMSDNFTNKLIESLKKNNISTIEDIIVLLKNKEHVKKMLNCDKFNIIDEINFNTIIDNYNKKD